MSSRQVILFATDFGEAASRARVQVGELARVYGSEVHLVHVQPSFLKTWFSSGLVERQASDRLQTWADEVVRAGAPKTAVHVHQGNPAETILQLADGAAVDLIVLGAGDKSLIERHTTGATAEAVATHARQPVWVSRPESTPAIRRVVCGVDGSESSGCALDEAVELSERLGAELMALSAFGSPDFNPLGMTPEQVQQATDEYHAKRVEQLDGFLREHEHAGCAIERRYVWGVESEVLRNFAVDETIDLIVLGRTGESRLRRILMGSTAQKLLRRAPCSVLLTEPIRS